MPFKKNLKKTIAFVIHSLGPGGAERVLTTLANALISDFNVIIIRLEDSKSFYNLHPDIKLEICDVRPRNNQNIINAINNNFQRLKILSEKVKRLKIDILIGFTTSVNVLTILAAKRTKTPVIISERNNAAADPPNLFWKALRNLTYKYANYLVVQTQPNKDFYSKLLPKRKIVVIQNPVAPDLALKRNRSNLAQNTILTVGRLDENKAQDLLIRAFANLPNKDCWKVLVAGEGNKRSEYEKLAKHLNIENDILFLGNVTNPEEYYNSATIFVFTSRSEGFPNALAEALYFGMPCISTDCPYGPSDLIENGENGLLIGVDNQKMLEVKLSNLMANEEYRKKLSENAIARSTDLNLNSIREDWMRYIVKCLN